MPKDLARLTVLLDAEKKKAFDELCAQLGTNASEVVRDLIRQYLSGDQRRPTLLGRPEQDESTLTGSR